MDSKYPSRQHRLRDKINSHGTNFSWGRTNFWRDLFRCRLNSSWLIAALCLGFLIGIGVSITNFAFYFIGMFWLVMAILLLALALLSRARIMIAIMFLSGVLLGIARGGAVSSSLIEYQKYIGRNVEIVAIVNDDPGLSSSNAITLKLVDVRIRATSEDKFQTLNGRVFVSLPAVNQTISRSDEVHLSGKLKAGFGGFAASLSYGKLDGITKITGSDPARDVRDAFGQKLRTVIPSPEADLGMGILAGQKTALPAALAAAFIAASLTHIVVASGYNLTILIRFARRRFVKISRFAALIFSGLLVFVFANVTGFSPSMTRASLVSGFSLFAWYYGRRFHPVVLLLLVAAITTAIDPTNLWGDAGWWMSFTSFSGVLIFAPLVKAYFWGDQKDFRPKRGLTKLFSRKDCDLNNIDLVEKKHSIRDIFVETLAAQLMSAPIIALMMGQFSPYGLLANLLVLPFVPLAMLLTFIAGVAAVILPINLAAVVSWPATQLLNYIIGATQWVASFPGSNQQVSFGIWSAVLVFALIIMMMIFMKWRTKHSFYYDNLIE